MSQLTQNEQYAFEIMELINSMFDEESENFRYDASKVDGTQFFTGFVKAGALLFNQLTGADIDFVEFTHIANRLIVQDLLGDEE